MEIGWSELLIVAVVALVVIGPKDLPEMFRTLGRFTAKLRSMAREFSRAMEDAARESGVEDVANDLRKVANPKSMGLDAVKSAADKFEKWDPLKATRTPPAASAPPAASTPPAVNAGAAMTPVSAAAALGEANAAAAAAAEALALPTPAEKAAAAALEPVIFAPTAAPAVAPVMAPVIAQTPTQTPAPAVAPAEPVLAGNAPEAAVQASVVKRAGRTRSSALKVTPPPEVVAAAAKPKAKPKAAPKVASKAAVKTAPKTVSEIAGNAADSAASAKTTSAPKARAKASAKAAKPAATLAEPKDPA